MEGQLNSYLNCPVLITGGLGFLGLNLAAALLEANSEVRILDIRKPDLEPEFQFITNRVKFYQGDLQNEDLVEMATAGCEIIFNLAGKSGAVDSNATPLGDLEGNVKGHISFLETCRRVNPNAKIVYPSSRLVYGAPVHIPVPETAPLKPRSIYGVHKIVAEQYHLLYARLYGLRTTILRITNPYGPFQPIWQKNYGIVNHFIQLALEDQTLFIYGDGLQLRDYVHVSDVIKALLICGLDSRAEGQIFNVGGDQAISFQAMTNLVVQLAGAGRIKFIEWPPEFAKVETGSFVADTSLIKRTVGWTPFISFESGLAETIESYKSWLSNSRQLKNSFRERATHDNRAG